jgi:competence protein ComEC
VDSARCHARSPAALTSLVGAAWFAAGLVLPWRDPRHWVDILLPLGCLGLLPAGRRVRQLILPLLLGVATGQANRLADPLPALIKSWSEARFEPWTTPVDVGGRLVDIESLGDARLALRVRATSFDLAGQAPLRFVPRRPVIVRLTVPSEESPPHRTPKPGDFVLISARIGPPRTFRNPGAFDYVSYLQARGVALVGTVKSLRLIRVVPGRRNRFAALPCIAREWVTSTLRSAAGEGEETTVSFLAALLVGEREDLPPEFEEHLLRAGVYHIVALSGFNVALLVSLASALLRIIPQSPRSRRITLTLCVLLYWGVVQSSGSIARAALMSVLYLGGAIVARRVSGVGALAAASILIAGCGPAWVVDPGFQLSLAASLGLALCVSRRSDSRAMAGTPIRPGRIRRALVLAGESVRGSFRVSAAALVSTALISARQFQTLAPAALVANLFAVPIAAVLLVVAILACALEPILHPAAAVLLVPARMLVDFLDHATAVVASVRWGSFYVLPPHVWLVLASQVAIVLAGFGGARLRRTAFVGLGLSILFVACPWREPTPTGRLEVTALDVGQGDALLIRFPDGLTMLMDAGGLARSSFDVGSKVVAPALRRLGLLKIDILAVTHAHHDHLGGAVAILKAFEPRALWLGRMPGTDPPVREIERLARERGCAVLFPRRGARIDLGGARLQVLNPGAGVEDSGPAVNDDSLVLHLSLGARSVLLTGDLEAPIETVLLREDREVGAELLKVGHHGSRTSTSLPFLRRVSPRFAVISVGAANAWGHPDAEVVSRLRDAGVEVFRTDRDGAVRFSTDGVVPWQARRVADVERGDSSTVTPAGANSE